MPIQHILIVEDEPVTRAKLQGYFQAEGYEVTAVGSAREMDTVLEQQDVHLLLLDIHLPDSNGLVITRELRSRSPIGIILVTGKTDDVDKIVGLELGADDYVTKPFNPRELLARVRNILSRVNAAVGRTDSRMASYKFDGITFDVQKRLVLDRNQNSIKLTRAEFELLIVFIEHPDQVLNRDRLMNKVTHRSWDPSDRTIDVLVMRLRKKIERDYKEPLLLTTVHGEGYAFTGLNL
ncbi:MAG: two-component system response regulator TorR [Gammaproteobacteria bacterium]|jgi:two-component system torCAD operon response regulator TorR|nr:two-component system response regulator TorR [Gammaproteobacteria bacterium]MCP4880042.1 two-component system response regulator TorR [Gammaproteobacteria bacterium]MDP6165869.1 two-component system response regulator TorR [Gammaproteobacteria bacterium]